VTQPQLLDRKVRRQLESPKNQLFLSPVSIWELSHLVRKGRIRLKRSLAASLEEMLTRIPVREAPFNFAVASRAAGIVLPQGDPGDIFIAATALAFELTVVTADSQFINCPWLATMPNG
jgi:PIN domain nuclease of toxin-antitoxin system